MLCSDSKAARFELAAAGRASCGPSEVPWRKRFSMAGGAAPPPRRRSPTMMQRWPATARPRWMPFNRWRTISPPSACSSKKRKQQRARRGVGAGIPAALHESLQRRGGHVPAGHHRPDRGADQRTERRRHPAAAHGRQRAADQGDRRRMERRRICRSSEASDASMSNVRRTEEFEP